MKSVKNMYLVPLLSAHCKLSNQEGVGFTAVGNSQGWETCIKAPHS